MYFCQERKVAFFMPTRTGSTTLKNIFDSWGLATVEGKRHCLPEDAQNFIPDIAEYKTYGFFRDPLERYLSCIRLLQQKHQYMQQSFESDAIVKKLTIGMDYVTMMEITSHISDERAFMFRPQVDWLANCELLDFDNYTAEVLKIARMFDKTQIKIQRHNHTDRSLVSDPCDEVKAFVREKYAADYALAKDRLGKEYV